MVKIDFSHSEKTLTCLFTGRLDTEVSLKIKDHIEERILGLKTSAVEPVKGYRIIFDLGKVNYISSSFIRICVNTAKNTERGSFSVINSDPMIKKTFKIAGLDDLLNVS